MSKHWGSVPEVGTERNRIRSRIAALAVIAMLFSGAPAGAWAADTADPGGTSETTDTGGGEQGGGEQADPAPIPSVLRWEVVDAGGVLISGTTVEVQGPAAPVTVVDNTGQDGYDGADTDPAAGAFLVSQWGADAVPADTAYLIRAVVADGYLVGDDADAQQIVSVPETDGSIASVTLTAIPAVDDDQEGEDQKAEGDDALGEVGVFSIPNPAPVDPGFTTLRITKLGARNGDGSVSPLEGATFSAYPSTRGGARSGATTLTCTTNGNGECDIVVPARTGGSNGSTQGYWVYETAAPSGWNSVGNLGLGNYDGAKTSTPYSFFTNNVSNSATIWEITEDATGYVGSGSNPSSTTHTAQNGFANVRANADFPEYCGLSIAIVFDKSTSINSSEMTSMRNAALGFIGTNGLGGTPSSVALYSFSTTATKFLDLTSIASNQTTVTNAINSQITGSGDGYTNWDDAMRKVAFNGDETYDVVLFLTDGDPTVNGTSGSNIETNIGFRNIEEGAFSANAVKQMTGPAGDRTKIVAVGIGLATNSYLNLIAISGQAAGDDYFTTDFAGLSSKLREIALKNCGGTVTVVKKTIDANGATIEEQAGGWEFTGQTDGAYIETPGGNVDTLAQTTPTEGQTRAVNFAVDLAGVESTGRALTITETQQPGFTPDSVTCTGATPTGDAASFSVNVTVNDIISCTVVNRLVPTYTVTVQKHWVDSVPGDTADISLTGTDGGTATAPDANDAVVVGTFRAGDSVTVSEVLGAGNAGSYSKALTCDTSPATTGIDTAGFTMPAQDVVCTFTNTNAKHDVTLVKKWVDGLQGDTAEITAGTTSKTSTGNGAPVFTDTANQVTVSVAQGATIDLSEVLGTGNTGSYSTTFACTTGTVTGSGTSHTLTVPASDVTCTYTNTASAAEVTLIKNWAASSFAGDTADLDIAVNGTSAEDGTSTAPNPTTLTQSVRIGDGVTLSETLGAGNTGQYDTSWVCTGTDAPADGQTSTTFTVTGATSCTVTNTPRTVTVTVNKTWVDGFPGDVADITVNGASGTSTLDDPSGNETDTGVVTTSVRIGDTVDIAETLPDANTGRYDSVWACSTQAAGTGTTIAFTARADVVCTFTNTARTHQVTLQKQWVDAIQGDTATLQIDAGTGVVSTANGDAGSWIDTANRATATVRVGDPVALAETVVSHSGSEYTSSYTCTPTGTVDAGTGTGFSIPSMPDADVVCTFTNGNAQGQLTLHKSVTNDNGGTAANTDWTLSAAGIVTITGADGDAAVTDAWVPAGDYTLNETDGPAGYSWTHVACTVGDGPAQDLAKDDNGNYVVPVAAQENVVCTFYNDDIAPQLTLRKTVDNTGGGTQPSTAWTLSATGDGGFSQPATQNVTATSSTTPTNPVKANVAYALGESVIPGYTAGDWTCTGGTLTDGAVKLPLGADVTCAITNTAMPSSGTVVKSVQSATQLADGTWEIVYDVVVTNTSAATTLTYDLTDTLRFGAGIDVVDASWTGPNGPGTFTGSSATLAADATLTTAVGTHTYTVTAHATVANSAAGSDTSVCSSQDGDRAFRNTASMTANGETTHTDACAQPWFPTIVKSASAPSQNDDATWNVSYTVTITNPGPGELATILRDALPAAPSGWSYAGGVWNVAAVGAAPAPTAPAFAPGAVATIWSGMQPVGSYAYTVSAVLVPSATAVPIDCQVQGGGLKNTATVISGEVTRSDTACITVTTPPVEVTKTVAGSLQLEDGTWQIDYTIVVHNTSTTSATVYTLADTPQLGTGFTVVSADWQDGAPTADTPIAADGTDTYTFRIVAAFDPVVTDPQLVCLPDDGGGAFSNGVVVTFPGGTDDGFACAEPGQPSVVKTAQPSVQNADGTWTLSYRVAVTNPSTMPLAYTATDTVAALPSGVTGGTWTATGPEVTGGGTGAVVDGWAGAGALATGYFPGGATHTYTVSRTVDVASSVTDATLTCGENPNQGGGVWNTATVSNGVGGGEDSDCAEIERPGVDVAKTVTSTVQLADGTWQISYRVTVTNRSDELLAVYSLTDELVFGGGITILDGADAPTWAGPGGSGGTFTGTSATLATDRVLAARDGDAGVDVYTVTATATIDADAWSGDTLICRPAGSGEAGGFLNVATVTAKGVAASADDCSTPKLPTIAKTGTSVTQDGANPDNWIVSYQVTVTPSGFDTFYTLQDVPGFADGVTLGAGTAQRTDIAGQPMLPIASGAAFPAAPVALGAADLPHTWTVTWQAAIPGGITPPGADVCGERPTPGKGFYNLAELLQGGTVIDDDDACLDITPRVYPTITKTVTSAAQGPDGTWTIAYDVAVSLAPEGPGNPDGLSAKYDLTDTLAFGGGITVDSATVTGPGTPGAFSGEPPTATLASGRTIVPGATDTFTVTVEATVTTAAIEDGTTECLPGSAPDAGGFLNTAVLSSGGQTTPVHDCAEPVFPTIEKTGAESHQNGDGSWYVSYEVTVSYPETDQEPEPNPVAFTLTDAPSLPAGVTVADGSTWSVSGLDGAPVVEPTWDGTGTWVIGEGTLPPGGQARYLVTTNVVVAPNPEGYEFTTCDDTDTTGILLPNTATVVSGAYSASDDGCTTVLPQPSWTVHKSSSPESGSTVRPDDTITYTLTVENTGQVPLEGAVITDDLSDVVDDATVSLPLEPGLNLSEDGRTLTWTVPTIAAGGEPVTASYTVTVDADAWGATLRNVITGDGPVPPADCPAIRPMSETGTEGADPCSTEHFVPEWTLQKSSNPASGSQVSPGSTITYTLTARNTGPVAVTGATATDDLSKVLSNATLVEPLPAGLTRSGNTLTWAIPDIAVEGTATVSYTVRVNSGANSVTLTNVVTPGDGGSCVESCTTTHRTPPPAPPLPITGEGISAALVLAAIALIGLGGGALLIGRRRRAESEVHES